MRQQLVSTEFLQILACPVCKSDVTFQDEILVCASSECKLSFPIVDGIPIMLAEGTEQHKRQKQYFDREFKTYDKYELENWRLSYLKRIFAALNIGDSEDDLYLDIGMGGSGYTVIEAARTGCRSVGVDISLEGIKKAKHFAVSELGSGGTMCSFVVCLAENLPFKDGAFTKISSVAVLEHIPDDRQAVAEIARVTKPSGRIFLTVPNAYRRMLPIFRLPYYLWDRRIGHLRHYEAEDLIAEFSRHNFSESKIVYTGHLAKIVQILLSSVYLHMKRKNSRLWWRLEQMDLKGTNDSSGLQLTVVMEKSKNAIR